MDAAAYTAAGAMATNLRVQEISAHNLANVNTPGFKASRIDFQDLLYNTLVPPGSETVVVPNTQVEVREQHKRMVVLDEALTVADVARALNALGATPNDIVTIFEDIYEQMLDDALAQAVSRGRGLGLAQAIEAQLLSRPVQAPPQATGGA